MIKITFEIWEDERGIKLMGHGRAKGEATKTECDFADAVLPKFMEFAYAQAKEIGLKHVEEYRPFTIIRRTKDEDNNRS